MLWKLLALCIAVVLGAVAAAELLASQPLDAVARSAIWKAAALSSLVASAVAYTWHRARSRRIHCLAKLAHDAGAPTSASLIGEPTDATKAAASFSGDELHSVALAIAESSAKWQHRLASVENQRRDLLTLLESIPEGVLAVDPEQRVLFANAGAYRVFGLPLRRMEGQRIWEVLRNPDFLDTVADALQKPDGCQAEIEMPGQQRVLSFHSRGLLVGPPGSIVMVLNDVTELRRLEKMRQEFLANVSHELKTPLASIKAYTETLLEHDLDDRKTQIRFLRRIEEQAERLHALVIDMLMLARFESRDPFFDIHAVDLHPVIRATVDAFQNAASAKRIRISTRLPQHDFSVLADAEGLAMILRNLVDNAVKYTPADGRVDIATEAEDNFVAIHVNDTGVGIPLADQGRIFERFYRVDKARSRELGGTGLGLSIVKHLAQTFGGTVGVQSEGHGGSRFSVRLPIDALRTAEPDLRIPERATMAAAT